jgi:hypothetical protein
MSDQTILPLRVGRLALASCVLAAITSSASQIARRVAKTTSSEVKKLLIYADSSRASSIRVAPTLSQAALWTAAEHRKTDFMVRRSGAYGA